MALYRKVLLGAALSLVPCDAEIIRNQIDNNLNQLTSKAGGNLNVQNAPRKNKGIKQSLATNLAQTSSISLIVSETEQEMEMNQQSKMRSRIQKLAGISHQLTMQDEDNMSQDGASTDSLSLAAMNKKIWGDDKQDMTTTQALTETNKQTNELSNAVKQDAQEAKQVESKSTDDSSKEKSHTDEQLSAAQTFQNLIDAHKADPAVKTYEMDMPKGASSAQKKDEKLTSESLFDSVMTPLLPLPKLGDDLIQENPSLAQVEKPADKKEVKPEEKKAEEKKVEVKAAEAKPEEKKEIKVEEKKEESKEDSPEEKARKEAVALQKTQATAKALGDASFLDPGKSLSITDVISVGRSYTMDIGRAPKQVQDTSSKISAKQLNEALAASAASDEAKPTQESGDTGKGFRVDLSNDDGAGYVGTIYVGANDSPARVLFDTGSDFLALTSDLCLDPKLGKQEVDEPVFDKENFMYKPSGKDHRKCKSTAYMSKESASAKALGGDDEKLDYGSAKLQGKLYSDRTCIDANKTACADFSFLALYQAQGLDDTDGVLGLAVHPDAKRRNLSYPWQLKQQGIIDRALVSFSIAGPNMDDQSYALFGGISPEQIVGGVGGLKKMATYSYRPDWTNSVKQWTLEAQNLAYGSEDCHLIGEEKHSPAIIDTGSSNLGVPDAQFKYLKEKWKRDVPNLDCVIDDNFCQTMTPCDQVQKKVKPISLTISGQVFEMEPSMYLHQAEGTRCQFAIHSNELKGSTGNLFLVGDILLRHLYQVYDFENQTISLGVNKHSLGQILMYPPGQRPENAPPIDANLQGGAVGFD